MNKKVCIIGLGLIGGSIGMAIKEKNLAEVIGLTRKRQKIGLALEKKAIDFGTTDTREAVREADIIFISYPIHLIIPELKKMIRFVKHGAIITDVGSTKKEIVEQAEKLMPKGVHFVGGHPMAGKEKIGLDIAESGLFWGKSWVLTRTKKTSRKALTDLKDLIRKLGAKAIVLDPAVHDSAVAGISHILVAVSASLVNAVDSSTGLKSLMFRLAASGFRDTTRVASGDPMLAVDMFSMNKKPVLRALASFKRCLSRIESAIKRGSASNIKKELSRAKSLRDSAFE